MVRIADILKSIKEKQGPEAPKESSLEEKAEVKEEAISKPKEEPPEKKVWEGKIEIAKAMAAKKEESISTGPPQMEIAMAMKGAEADKEKARKLYHEGISLTKSSQEKVKKDVPPDLNQIKNFIEQIVDQIILGDTELLSLVITFEFSPQEYHYITSLNTSVLAIKIGLEAGYNKSKIVKLGMCAFLHDLGMIKTMDIAKQPRRLTKEECDKIKGHPEIISEIVNKIKEADETLVRVVKEVHERLNGEGYPSKLKNGEIHEYSQIIGLVNTYEAMMHTRPYRGRFLSHDVVKEILNHTAHFSPALVKILIHSIGLYPLGSWVELNTGEIGKVVNIHKNYPLRPVVNVFFDFHKEKLQDIRVINLIEKPSLYIKRSLSDEEIAREIKTKLNEGGERE